MESSHEFNANFASTKQLSPSGASVHLGAKLYGSELAIVKQRPLRGRRVPAGPVDPYPREKGVESHAGTDEPSTATSLET
jgi:hypothetical protein